MHEPSSRDAFLFRPDWTLASIGDAVIITDSEGRVTFLNAVAQSLTGWTQEEASGISVDTVFQIVHPETRTRIESPTIRALREGVNIGLTNRTLLIAKDGTELPIGPIDDSAAPIRNEKGELAGVVLVFRDVTELCRHEQTVQVALTYADNIIATLREPFVVLDKSLRVKTANQTFYDTFRVEKSETECRFIFELGNGQRNNPRLRALLDDVLTNDHPVLNFDMEHDFPLLGKKIMLLNARKFASVESHSDLILLAIEEITARKQTELALKGSETRYRRLFETAKDGILILDTESGRITDANPFMSELLGYPHEHFLGKELWEIGLFSDKAGNEAAVRTLQERGYIRYKNLSLETSRGLRVEVEVVAYAYREDHHNVIQCNIRDITERSRLEKQMQEQSASLTDLHRRKDEFLAMLGHELRNPLAPIINAIELLRLQSNEGVIQKKARTLIERQVRQLTRLVDELLEVSRITSGRIHLQKERISLNGIVERAIETTRPLIDQHKHELVVTLSPQSIWLEADSTRMEQVIVNLLTNAAKYTPDHGCISLTVQLEDNIAVLRITDNGIGISSELLPHIFELFTQAERSIDRSQGGLGIGLTLVQRLVEMHGGKVDASSVLGQGSEFVVRLPVLVPPVSQLQSQQKDAPKQVGANLRVLVVDDNVDAADSLSLLLVASGHDVRTTYDGISALRVAFEFQPNVVLLDIGLPQIDGFEVSRRLRNEPAFKNIVLVALTGYGTETDKRLSLDAGFDHHLVKPASFSMVKEILSKVSLRLT